MATRAKQVVHFPGRRQQRRTVESRNHPDTFSLTLALQTTLDVEAQLKILYREISSHLSIEGASYIHQDLKISYRFDDVARHSCSYNMDLMGKNLGTLEFTRSSRFSEEELDLIEHLLSVTLYPLNNAIDYQKAIQLAHRDPLTGIANRLSLNEALIREINRTQRYNLSLTILMIDLDHFKAINDSYGHSSGDLVLQESATRIENSLRLSDQAFRIGGEEFVVLLPDTDLESAKVVAERIRKSIASKPVTNNEFEINFTTSIGIAELGEHDNEKSLFDHADKALYLAKNGGRNRFASWNERELTPSLKQS